MRQALIKKISSSIIVDKAIYFDKHAYEDAKNDYFIKIRKNLNNILAIYQLGTINVPGISDIDYFIVFKNAKISNVENYSINSLPERSKYLFSHNPWFINKEIFANLNYWFPYFDIVKVWGENIDIDEFGKDKVSILTLLLSQYLLTKVPVDFITYSISDGRFYERIMLCMINSLIHTFNLVQRIFGTIPEQWVTFSNAFKEFRENWFMRDGKFNRKCLIEFCADAILFSFDLLEYLPNKLRQDLLININSRKLIFNSGHKTLSFINKWSKEQAIDIATTPNNFLFSYPKEFGFYLVLWSCERGKVGRHIRKNLKGKYNLQVSSSMREMFKKHANAIEKYQNFSVSKFARPAPGYHVMWCPLSSNGYLDLGYKIFNKVLKYKPS